MNVESRKFGPSVRLDDGTFNQVLPEVTRIYSIVQLLLGDKVELLSCTVQYQESQGSSLVFF